MKTYIKLWALLFHLLLINGEKLKFKRSLFGDDYIVTYKNSIPTDYATIANDALNPNRKYRLTESVTKIKSNINGGAKLLKSALTGDPFQFNVLCEEKSVCDDYSTKIEQGSQYISNALEFYEVVNVNVTIFPFCQYLDSSKCSSIMGITYPPTFIPLVEVGEENNPFLYPQALVKQLELDGQPEYATNDFVIYLNGDYTPETAKDNRSLIAAHEIIHGLGFFHQAAPLSIYLNNLKNYFENDFVMPPISSKEEVKNGKKKIHYDGWTPFSVFDKYVVGVSQPNDYIYKKLLKFYEHEIDFYLDETNPTQAEAEKFMSTFQSFVEDTEAYTNGVEAAKLFTTLKAVGFKTSSGDIVPLQTFDGVYESASSISHISVPFDCASSSRCSLSNFSGDIGEEYLMFFTIIGAYSTEFLIDNFSQGSKYGIIGPQLLSVLTTMGWTEKNTSKKEDKFYAYEDDGGVPYLDSSTYGKAQDSGAMANVKPSLFLFVLFSITVYQIFNTLVF